MSFLYFSVDRMAAFIKPFPAFVKSKGLFVKSLVGVFVQCSIFDGKKDEKGAGEEERQHHKTIFQQH